METSWFVVKAGVKRRAMRKRKQKNDEGEEEELWKRKKDCLELGIDDICLNFPTFLLGFASSGFAASLSLFSHTLPHTQKHSTPLGRVSAFLL